jgi:hypothetical protein
MLPMQSVVLLLSTSLGYPQPLLAPITPTSLPPMLCCRPRSCPCPGRRFQEWPDEALKSVATSFLGDVELGDDAAMRGGRGEGMLSGVVAACVGAHQAVEAASRRFYDVRVLCLLRLTGMCTVAYSAFLECDWLETGLFRDLWLC